MPFKDKHFNNDREYHENEVLTDLEVGFVTRSSRCGPKVHLITAVQLHKDGYEQSGLIWNVEFA